jgi:hypothetical protein
VLGVLGPNAQFVKKLNHEASETLEGSRYTDSRADFDENAFGGVNVDLEFAGFVDWRVEESKKALCTGVSRRWLVMQTDPV